MIIATSQEFAAVDCCGCLPLECGNARTQCRSVEGYVESEGFFNAEDTEWIIYSEETITYTGERDGPINDGDYFTGYGQTIYVNSYSTVFAAYVPGDCQNWTPPQFSQTCNAYGSYIVTVMSQTPWTITHAALCVQPVVDDCEFNYTEMTYTHSNPEVESPTYDTLGWGGMTGGYLLTDSTEARTYANGFTFDEWIAGAKTLLLEELDFDLNAELPDPYCREAYCSPRYVLPNRPAPDYADDVGPVQLRTSRYRVGVPYGADDMPRSVFEAQWDIYSFPIGWLAWNEAVEAHAAAVLAHADWVIAQAFYDANIGAYNAAMLLWWDLAYAWEDYYLLHDYWTFFPGDFPEGEPQPPEEELVPAPTPPPWPGSEPIVPADPGSWVGSAYNTCDDSDGPALVSSGSWIWGGDMGAPNADPVIFAKNPEQWSPWFDMPMPELPTPLSDAWDEDGNFKSDCINRDFLVCNMMTKCYNSTRMGVAPTIHPPIYIPPAV